MSQFAEIAKKIDLADSQEEADKFAAQVEALMPRFQFVISTTPETTAIGVFASLVFTAAALALEVGVSSEEAIKMFRALYDVSDTEKKDSLQ